MFHFTSSAGYVGIAARCEDCRTIHEVDIVLAAQGELPFEQALKQVTDAGWSVEWDEESREIGFPGRIYPDFIAKHLKTTCRTCVGKRVPPTPELRGWE